MGNKQGIAFSLILVPILKAFGTGLRGVPKIIGTNPLKYDALLVFKK
jgi:hypothetical protein